MKNIKNKSHFLIGLILLNLSIGLILLNLTKQFSMLVRSKFCRDQILAVNLQTEKRSIKLVPDTEANPLKLLKLIF